MAMKRREFMGLAAALALPLEAEEPNYKFPTEPRKRMAVSSYPFRRLIASPHAKNGEGLKSGMTLEQFAQTIGPKFEVAGIEPWSPHFESTEEAYLQKLRKAFDLAGVHVVNIPVDASVHLCGTDQQRQDGLAVYHKWVDAAVMLGSPGIRVHMPHGQKSTDKNCAVETLKSLSEYGAAKHIVINVENDNPDTEQPEQIVGVLETVNSPYLRALPDFCNSMLIHDSQTYNDEGLSKLFPLAFNISHVKDMEVDGDKTYRVNMEQIFRIAKKAGYRGYFSVEWEGRGDEYIETKKLVDASIRDL